MNFEIVNAKNLKDGIFEKLVKIWHITEISIISQHTEI